MKGNVFAQGLVNYSSVELDMLKGKQMNECFESLGYYGAECVIHRGNIVLFQFDPSAASPKQVFRVSSIESIPSQDLNEAVKPSGSSVVSSSKIKGETNEETKKT